MTCRKRLLLLCTMLSRMSSDTCCMEASVTLALTKLAIWRKERNVRRKAQSDGSELASGALAGGRRSSTFLMKTEDRFSQETMPWSMSCIKAVSVWVMIRLLLCERHVHEEEGGNNNTAMKQHAWMHGVYQHCRFAAVFSE